MRVDIICTDWQREVIEAFLGDDIRFLSVMAGRRAGKTYACRHCLAVACLHRPDWSAWYIAPNYAQAKEQYEGISALPAIQPYIKRVRQQPYPLIEFHNGSSIGFRSAERMQTLRGSGLNAVWVDEVQDISGDKFWAVIRPLISDRRGKLVISGQHRGEESWYYKDLFAPGIRNRPKYKSWQIPSSRGLVYLTEEGQEELELVKQQVPRKVYEQEYECLPMANQAAVFDSRDLQTSKRGDIKPPEMCGPVVLGLDLGRVVDPSAMVGVDTKDLSVVFAAKRPLKEKHEIGARKAGEVARRYGNATIVIDTTGGAKGGVAGKHDAYVQYYRQYCPTMRAYTFTRDNKEMLVANLSLALERGEIAIPEDFEALHKELQMYEYKVSNNGIVSYQGPGGHDDDMVMALALAWEGVKRGWASHGKVSQVAYV